MSLNLPELWFSCLRIVITVSASPISEAFQASIEITASRGGGWEEASQLFSNHRALAWRLSMRIAGVVSGDHSLQAVSLIPSMSFLLRKTYRKGKRVQSL